jgi:uncharacterized caspase-like protein
MIKRRDLIKAIAVGALPMWSPPASSAEPEDRRVALCIGNSTYPGMPLKNSGNDAKAVGESLKTSGYEVTIRENLNFRDTVSQIREFTDLASKAHVRLIYFAGHGLQTRARNFLLPIEPLGQTTEAVLSRAIAVDDILDRLTVIKTGVNILVLDACRTNVYHTSQLIGPDGRQIVLRNAAKQGLSSINPPFGSVLAYSTAPGKVASDNPNDPLGIYAKHFVKELSKKNQAIEGFFKLVRTAVTEETQRAQVPWESSSLTGQVCVKAGPPICT